MLLGPLIILYNNTWIIHTISTFFCESPGVETQQANAEAVMALISMFFQLGAPRSLQYSVTNQQL